MYDTNSKILLPFLNISLLEISTSDYIWSKMSELIYTLKYVYIHPYVPVHLKSLKRLIFRNEGSKM